MSELVDVTVLVLVAAVVVLALVVVGVMRQLGAVLLQVQPSAVRDVGGGPDVGVSVALPGLAMSGGALIAFLAPRCEPCERLRPALQSLAISHPALALAGVVAFGSDEEREEYLRELGPLARGDLGHLRDEWHIPGTPYLVSVDSAGRIRAKGVVNTPDQLSAMADAAVAPPEENHEGHVVEDMSTNGNRHRAGSLLDTSGAVASVGSKERGDGV